MRTSPKFRRKHYEKNSDDYCGIMLMFPKPKELYPEMQFDSEIKPEQELIDGLKHREFQLITLANEISENGFCCQKIGTERLRISVLPAHPAPALDSVRFANIDVEAISLTRISGFGKALSASTCRTRGLLLRTALKNTRRL